MTVVLRFTQGAKSILRVMSSTWSSNVVIPTSLSHLPVEMFICIIKNAPRVTTRAVSKNELSWQSVIVFCFPRFNGHKLVHLDLGGAPPKLTYLLQVSCLRRLSFGCIYPIVRGSPGSEVSVWGWKGAQIVQTSVNITSNSPSSTLYGNFKENDNTLKFAKHVSIETSVIFSW